MSSNSVIKLVENGVSRHVVANTLTVSGRLGQVTRNILRIFGGSIITSCGVSVAQLWQFQMLYPLHFTTIIDELYPCDSGRCFHEWHCLRCLPYITIYLKLESYSNQVPQTSSMSPIRIASLRNRNFVGSTENLLAWFITCSTCLHQKQELRVSYSLIFPRWHHLTKATNCVQFNERELLAADGAASSHAQQWECICTVPRRRR